MNYFKYPCATKGCWKAGSTLLCVLMIILGAYNIAHGVIFRQLYNNARDANTFDPYYINTVNDVVQAQLMPVGALIIVAGSIVIAIYFVAIILIFLQIDQILWLKIVNIINMIAFGFQFAVGVASCLQVIYFKQLYKPYLQTSFVDTIKAGPDGPIKTLILKLVTTVHMTQAEAVLAFVIGLLCPLILLITLNYKKQERQERQGKNAGQPYKDNGSAQKIMY